MVLHIRSTLSVCFAVVALAALIGAPGSAAAASDRREPGPVHRVQHVYAVHHWAVHHWQPSAQRFKPVYGYVNVPPGAIIGPGYVFVPGRGILDEACNLPTSTCPNTERDTQ